MRSAGSGLHADQQQQQAARELLPVGARELVVPPVAARVWETLAVAAASAGAGGGNGAGEPLNGRTEGGAREDNNNRLAVYLHSLPRLKKRVTEIVVCVFVFIYFAHTSTRVAPAVRPPRTGARTHTADATRCAKEKRAAAV